MGPLTPPVGSTPSADRDVSHAAARLRVRVMCAAAISMLSVATMPVAATSAAQGRLERATLRTSILPDSGAARVQIEYIVIASGTGRDTVPVTLLRFDGATVRNIITRVNGVAVDPLLRADESGLRLRGAVPLASGVPTEPAVAPAVTPAVADTVVAIAVSYDVMIARADPARPLRLPILAVMWPPSPALPGTFLGEVAVPAELRIYDPFPSNLRLLADDGGRARGVAAHYTVDLPVVPAMISFNLAPHDQPVVTLANVLDVFVLLAVAVLWTFMWRQFRRET